MTDPMIVSSNPNDIDSLRSQLVAGSEKTQQEMIQQLASLGNPGLDVLMEFLVQRSKAPMTWVDGKAYQVLYTSQSSTAQEFLQAKFPTGIIPLESDQGIDYTKLQQLLAARDFQVADKLTIEKMCELAGADALKRKWLYFTEVENFPVKDLQTINNLWLAHSEGKFGFSVQREIWLRSSKNWENMWAKIGWKKGNDWTRYPSGFIWSLDAPRGHLPLSNQLRGVRVIAALLSHPAWSVIDKD
ncbi:MAG: GUN4 domain-containing protein [Cyanobacteria bacterium P01_A01_bin.84]